MENLEQKQYLLAAHYFYDFSTSVWQAYWPQHPMDFTELPFAKRDNIFEWPNTWEAAIDFVQNHLQTIETHCFFEASYPAILQEQLGYPPPVLYMLGKQIPQPNSLISIVGTRRPSAFGINSTYCFSKFISQEKLGIVSGLARGIDTLAHETALRYGTYTLAILGSGLKNIYPRENQKLVHKILVNGGTVLSMFPPNATPLASNFPRRNFLIAAFSAGTIVIEGSVKSGAAITGKAALEMELVTVSLTQDYRSPYGHGAIQLIQDGAVAVRNVGEALTMIAAPYGGELISLQGQPLTFAKSKRNNIYPREFSLQEFQEARGLEICTAMAQLEELCLTGALKKIAENRYMFSKDC